MEQKKLDFFLSTKSSYKIFCNNGNEHDVVVVDDVVVLQGVALLSPRMG